MSGPWLDPAEAQPVAGKPLGVYEARCDGINHNASCIGQFHSLTGKDRLPCHLHESGALATLCGAGVRDGDGKPWDFWAITTQAFPGPAPVANSVHVSKARKTDCPACRDTYRQRIKARRAYGKSRCGVPGCPCGGLQSW